MRLELEAMSAWLCRFSEGENKKEEKGREESCGWKKKKARRIAAFYPYVARYVT